jgi:hypothetical protein
MEAFVKRNEKLIRWESFQHPGLEEIVIEKFSTGKRKLSPSNES